MEGEKQGVPLRDHLLECQECFQFSMSQRDLVAREYLANVSLDDLPALKSLDDFPPDVRPQIERARKAFERICVFPPVEQPK